MKRFLAFTLAETLIVMGIIGIVSALTLPNLNSSTGEKEKVAKVKKLYQNINDAYGRATAIYGPLNEWFLSDTTEAAQKTRFYERMTEFMKVSKSDPTNHTAILADGTSIKLPDYIYLTNMNFQIEIDIDGLNKGKNSDGVDKFWFTTSKCTNDNCTSTTADLSEFRPYFLGYTTFGSSQLLTSCQGHGCTCAYWVVNFDNMDYLKLDSSGKCPNGKALNVLANPPVISCR